MSAHKVGSSKDLSPGERMIVEIKGKEIGIFNIDDRYYAYPNWCFHQHGPCCEGKITGYANAVYDRDTLQNRLTFDMNRRILHCPWHGWEYDLKSGECLSNKKKLPSYNVRVRDSDLIIDV